jgi:N-acetylmuramoyl-L-alanine amidase
MSSLSRVFPLLTFALIACGFLQAPPCLAAEGQVRHPFRETGGPAVVYRPSGAQSDFVEKLSPSRNCTGNPFFIGPKTGLTAIASPEKEASPWAQPSAAGHPAPSGPKRFEEVKNAPEPVVIRRSPEALRTSQGNNEVIQKLSPTQNCTGNPFFAIPNTISKPPSESAPRAAIPPPQSTDDSRSSRQPFRGPGKRSVIVLDPGHGGKDPGAVSQDGLIKEKDLSLDIAMKLKAKIESALPDSAVVLTRNKDAFLTLEDRTFIANSMKADLFLSIHCNSDADSSAEGIETYFLSKSDSRKAMLAAVRENDTPLAEMTDFETALIDHMASAKTTESVKLATTVHDQIMRRLGRTKGVGRDRGVKAAPLYVLLGAKMPAMMVECGFISNNSDKIKLTSPEYRETIANGLADGLITYLKSSQQGIRGTFATNILRLFRGI